MKIRSGFVSNSSSASFCIRKGHLTKEQIDMIVNHVAYLMQEKCPQTCNIENEYECNYCIKNALYDMQEEHSGWDIKESEELITGNTNMDNFNMSDYLIAKVGVDKKFITFDYY